MDGSERTLDEELYQSEIAALANVSSFGDWVLLLRYVVFYFEDRRSLIWDPSAQRELFRVLFLPPETAELWTTKSRDILEDDSMVRNLHNAVTRAERELAKSTSLISTESSTRTDLLELEEEQRGDVESLDQADTRLSDLVSEREDARLRFIRLEHDRDSAYRELERAQLLAIEARLPQHSDSARYLLSHLFTEFECLVCGHEARSVVASLRDKIGDNECIICGSRIETDEADVPLDLASGRVDHYEDQFLAIDAELKSAQETLSELTAEFNRILGDSRELRAAVTRRHVSIDALTDRLPPADAEVREQRREFGALHESIRALQRDLKQRREDFAEMVDALTAAVTEQATKVKEAFEGYAHEFLFEDCQLSWQTRRERLGQVGRFFEFPVFELDLGGSDFKTVVRRSGPDDVSESQREFIDLSFRMALANVAERQGVTSLVMDAPESSLDAVFVDRAARVLGAFGRAESGNRLVVTSNLVGGDLIPRILEEATEPDGRGDRVVDLLSIAAPTAAILAFGADYREARDRLLAQADVNK